jgi:hypothetical protein
MATWGQAGIKSGVVLSGFRATHSDARYWMGEDYRPFLGYEVEWVVEGDYPDLGIQVGVFYTHRLSRFFSLQPEIHFAPRGLGFEQIELYNSSYHLNVNYLHVPMLLCVTPFPRWGVRPTLLAGPYGAVKLSANRVIDVWGERDTESLPNVRNMDYGLVLGVGAEFSAWARTLIVELRLDWGLANSMTQREEYTDLFADPGRMNVVAMSLMAGYRL